MYTLNSDLQPLENGGFITSCVVERHSLKRLGRSQFSCFTSKETVSQTMYKVMYPANIYWIPLFDVQRLTIQNHFTQRTYSLIGQKGENLKTIYIHEIINSNDNDNYQLPYATMCHTLCYMMYFFHLIYSPKPLTGKYNCLNIKDSMIEAHELKTLIRSFYK